MYKTISTYSIAEYEKKKEIYMKVFSNLFGTKKFPFKFNVTPLEASLLLDIIKDQKKYFIEYTYQYKPDKVLTIDNITENFRHNGDSCVSCYIPKKLHARVFKPNDSK